MDDRRNGNHRKKRVSNPRFRHQQQSLDNSISLTSHSPEAKGRPRPMRPRTNGNGTGHARQPQVAPAPFTPPPVGDGKVDAFELFCTLLLGITHDNRYRPQNLHDAARRFGVSLAEIKNKVIEFGMDPESIRNSDFDLESAKYDIKVAPEGISRKELAKDWYEEFKATVKKTYSAFQGAPLPSNISTPIFDEDN